MVSLLKAWWGPAATKDNDFAYDYMPKREKADAYSHQHFHAGMLKGKVKGFIVMGQNPAVDSPNAKMSRQALRNLEWLVVVDLFETDTAAVWKAPGVDPKSSKVEVFFIPGAPAAEKDGSITNTMRLAQWHVKAVDPPGDARSDAAFIVDVGNRVKELYKDSRPSGTASPGFGVGLRAPGAQERAQDGAGPEGVQRLRHRGHHREGPASRSTSGQPMKTFGHLRDDGSTACGNWIYTGIYPEEGKNLALRRDKPKGAITGPRLGLRVAGQSPHPVQPRVGRCPGAAVEREEEAHLVGRQGEEVGRQRRARLPRTMAPDAPRAKDGPLKGISGTDAFIMNPHGLGQFFASVVDGPFPEHYEPFESPTQNLLSKVQNNPVAKVWDIGDLNKLGTPDKYPYVLTTYRLTEHHAAGMSRHVPWLVSCSTATSPRSGRRWPRTSVSRTAT